MGDTYTSLYPIVDMINHANPPNACIHHTEKSDELGVAAVVAYRDIQPGEEVTISYGENREQLKKKWGIVEEE